jgi:hypothetical protein
MSQIWYKNFAHNGRHGNRVWLTHKLYFIQGDEHLNFASQCRSTYVGHKNREDDNHSKNVTWKLRLYILTNIQKEQQQMQQSVSQSINHSQTGLQ